MEKPSIILNFEGIKIDVKFKPIRTLRLVIKRDGTPSMSVPLGFPQSKVLNFLKQHQDWIVRKQKEVQTRRQKEDEEEIHTYKEGEEFYFLGKSYPLRFRTQNISATVTCQPDGLWVISRTPLPPASLQRLINAWYIRQIKEIIQTLVKQWLGIMKEKDVNEIRFRKMTSQWGNCSPSRRTLCFNTRLVFKPIECIEEVVVHELCHLKEASHNKRFHALMKFYLPDYLQRNKILNRK